MNNNYLDTPSEIFIAIANDNDIERLIITKEFTQENFLKNILEYYTSLENNDKIIKSCINQFEQARDINIKNMNIIADFIRKMSENADRKAN